RKTNRLRPRCPMTHLCAPRLFPQPLVAFGTDTPVCALGFPCAPGFSPSRHRPNDLEGAPPLVCKGGLLRSIATSFLISHLAFLFHESRFTNHESLTPVAVS